MSGLDDLGRALRDDAAANAPRASAIDVEAVARAARARRRPRLIGVGALALVGSLGLGGLAVGALAPPALIAAGESADAPAGDALAPDAQPESLGTTDGGGAAPEGDDLARVDALACGAPVDDAADGDPRLRLDATLPSSVESGIGQFGTTEPPSASGVVRIINETDTVQLVQTRSAASAALVRDGLIVGEGTIVADVALSAALDPGVSLDVPVSLLTVSCQDGSPLPAGDYSVLVSVEVAVSPGEALLSLLTLAGPLRVE